jgi:hypothetical protein
VDDDSSTEQDDDSDSDDAGSVKSFTDKEYKIPRLPYAHRSKDDIARLRIDLPNLAHHPDDTFRKHSVTELIRWDNNLEGNWKLGRKLTEKMSRNLDNMKKTPKR